MSTLEASSAPCVRKVARGAAATWPEVGEAMNALSPTGVRFWGERTDTSVSFPRRRPFAVTVPSPAIAMSASSVPFGTVICGTTSAPVLVARRPRPSTWRLPSRVIAWVPSASRTRRKPSPWIAM